MALQAVFGGGDVGGPEPGDRRASCSPADQSARVRVRAGLLTIDSALKPNVEVALSK